jgi:hypothetical protein
MRFYPRNSKSRHDALVGPNHVAQHSDRNAQSLRDELIRYGQRDGSAVGSVSASATFNETDVVNGAVKATGTLTLTPGAITDGDIIVIDGIYYEINTTVVAGAGTVGSPYSVLKGASDTTALANLRKAINATGVDGTDYSTGLVAHPTVTATASDATSLSAQARTAGTAGNAIATTVGGDSTADGLAWGAATLAGGFDAVVIVVTVNGNDKFVDDAITVRSALLIAAVPATDGINTGLDDTGFALSNGGQTLTITLPAIGAYTISADAHYDFTFDKSLFQFAVADLVATSALNVVNGA